MSDDSEPNREQRTRDQPTHQQTMQAGAVSPRAAQARYDDEVSLRELYLILKRGLPLILAVAVVAAVLAAAYVWIAPDVYESEATVVSAPTTVQVQGEGTLAFEPRSSITFATYENIATSRATLEATIDRLRDADVDAPESLRGLLGAVTVERLTGSANPSDATPLTVVHRVAWFDPVLAARYADAWAETTVAQVRSTLLADLEPARAQLVDELEKREAALAEAEAAYREFQSVDLPGVERELRTVTDRIAVNEDALAELDREIAALDARRTVLLAQVGEGSDGALDPDALDLLADTGRIDPSTAARLRELADAGGASDTDAPAVGATLALLARSDLRSASVELGGLLQERALVDEALAASETRAAALRDRIADLRLEDARLSRRLEAAKDAYQAVQTIEPALAFVANLTPGNTRVLNRAQEPTDATGPSTSLVALLAALAAAVAATLFVFLREAVRDPAAESAGRRGRSDPPAPRSA